MADESLDYTINIKTQATLKNLEDLRKAAERVKAEMVDVAKTSDEAFSTIAKKAADTAADLQKQGVGKGKEETLAYALAVKELVAQQKTLNEEQKEIAESTITFMNAMKGINETVSRMEMQTATKNVQTFRQELDRVTQAAINLQAKTGESWNVVVNAIKQEDAASIKGAASTDVYTAAKKNLNAELQKQIAVMNMLKGIDVGGAKVEQQATISFLNTMKGIQTTAVQAQQQVGGLAGVFANLQNKLQSFGVVGQAVFGGMVGGVAFFAVQKLLEAGKKLIQFFIEATQAAIEFTRSTFTLEIAVRGLQRIGLDTTIKEWKDNITALKKEFPIFSRKDFTDAASLAALMTREFGFTVDQMQNLIRLSTTLSLITGKDLQESIRGVTYAIGSGYFESLQRAGINISRQIVAEEALRQGYEGSYTALNQNVRAMLTYNIIQANMNALSDDAARAQETVWGKQQKLSASWEDFTLYMGEEFIPVAQAVLDILNKIVDALIRYEIASKKAARLPAHMRVAAAVLPMLDSESKDLIGDEKIAQKQAETDAARQQEILEAMDKFNVRKGDIEAEGRAEELEINEKFWKDLEDNYAEHMQKMEDIKADYDQRIADIGLKESRAAADEEMDYAFKVAEAARQAAFRKEEAERRYREREINAEKRFQEKMRQLRENFLLNLEDAVRERDALQIIRLTRQYNLRKTQMEREEGISGDERGRAFQEELRQIEAQRLERQRQLAIEHQRREEDIARQAERERAQALIEFERKEADEKARALAEDTARDEKWKQDMLDLDAKIQERINKVLDGLVEEYSLSEKELRKWGELYYGTFVNADSAFNVAIDHAIARLAQLNEFHRRTMAMLGFGALGGKTPAEEFGETHAEGGTVIANKPTTVTFGEAGLEMATFTPLNRAGVNTNQVVGSMPAGMGGGGSRGGKYVVGISLSPGLEGKIVGQALDQAADIIFKLERARR